MTWLNIYLFLGLLTGEVGLRSIESIRGSRYDSYFYLVVVLFWPPVWLYIWHKMR